MNFVFELMLVAAAGLVGAASGWLLGAALTKLDAPKRESRYQSYVAAGAIVCVAMLIVAQYAVSLSCLWMLLLAFVALPLTRYMFRIDSPADWLNRHYPTSHNDNLQCACAYNGAAGSVYLAITLAKTSGLIGAVWAVLGFSWFLAPAIASGAFFLGLMIPELMFCHWLKRKLQ